MGHPPSKNIKHLGVLRLGEKKHRKFPLQQILMDILKGTLNANHFLLKEIRP